MIDTKELRRLAQAATPGPWHATKSVETNSWAVWSDTTRLMELRPTKTVDMYRVSNTATFIAAVNPAAISELLDRLEAAESDGLEQARLNGMGGEREAALLARLEAAEKERDALRTEIEAMENQGPVFWYRKRSDGAYEGPIHNGSIEETRKQSGAWSPLYALPGAQPAPNVPSLDMDAIERQNDELKEEVGKLREALALIADQYEPKCNLLIPSIARSALCATGAYGQTKAQPAPSVPSVPDGVKEGSARFVLQEQARKLAEVWGKVDDPYAVAYGWIQPMLQHLPTTPSVPDGWHDISETKPTEGQLIVVMKRDGDPFAGEWIESWGTPRCCARSSGSWTSAFTFWMPLAAAPKPECE